MEWTPTRAIKVPCETEKKKIRLFLSAIERTQTQRILWMEFHCQYGHIMHKSNKRHLRESPTKHANNKNHPDRILNSHSHKQCNLVRVYVPLAKALFSLVQFCVCVVVVFFFFSLLFAFHLSFFLFCFRNDLIKGKCETRKPTKKKPSRPATNVCSENSDQLECTSKTHAKQIIIKLLAGKTRRKKVEIRKKIITPSIMTKFYVYN